MTLYTGKDQFIKDHLDMTIHDQTTVQEYMYDIIITEKRF